MSHPTKDIIGTEGDQLAEKKILLCVTGSVAIMKSAEIAREMMRRGAEVHVAMTPSACDLISPDFMEWATSNPVLTHLTGKLEHVAFVQSGDQKIDLLLVAPATANTLTKISLGIGDTALTTTVYAALGAKIPVLVAPAMHEPMMRHPVYEETLQKLRDMEVRVVQPFIEERKAKMAEVDEIVEAVIRQLYPKDLADREVMVTAGPTIEPIDAVRIITNRSSGKMGVALAREAARRGADVTLVYGTGTEPTPTGVNVLRSETTKDMYDAVMSHMESHDPDLFIAAGAPCDYTAEDIVEHKISSRDRPKIEVTLVTTQKVVKAVREVSERLFLVAFKAEHDLSNSALIDKAHEWLVREGADLIVANDVGREDIGFGADANEVFIIDNEKNVTHLTRATKEEIASRIVDTAVEHMQKRRTQSR